MRQPSAGEEQLIFVFLDENKQKLVQGVGELKGEGYTYALEEAAVFIEKGGYMVGEFIPDLKEMGEPAKF